MSDEIGEFLENPGEMHGEWWICDFMFLPKDLNRVYSSPKFFFSDACWCWKIYPNYHTAKKSEEWIGLYLSRLDSGPQKSMRIVVGVLKGNGLEEIVWDESLTFDIRQNDELGNNKFLQKSELAPLGSLILRFSLMSESQNSSEGSLFRRLWNMSRIFKYILTTRKETDVVLKMGGGKIPAHTMILESRSAAFKSLFGVNMQGSTTGEVNVKDAHVDAFNVVLSYVYSGEPEGLSSENVYDVHKLALKYNFKDLTKLCREVMQDCLSMDTVCDAIALAKCYGDKTLRKRANDYFAKNKTEIFKTEKWKRFKRAYPETGCELLECVLRTKYLKRAESTPSPVCNN